MTPFFCEFSRADLDVSLSPPWHSARVPSVSRVLAVLYYLAWRCVLVCVLSPHLCIGASEWWSPPDVDKWTRRVSRPHRESARKRAAGTLSSAAA